MTDHTVRKFTSREEMEAIHAAEKRIMAIREMNTGKLKSPEAVLAYVAKKEGVTIAQLIGPSQRPSIAYPRFRAMHLLRQIKRGGVPLSFPAIGQVLGGRDHTTIMSGLKRAEELGLTEELH